MPFFSKKNNEIENNLIRRAPLKSATANGNHLIK